MSDYPEHDKLTAVREKSQAIGEFLDAMSDKGVVLCSYNEGKNDRLKLCREGFAYLPAGYYPENMPIKERLAEFFGIDLDALEREKQAMLDACRQPRK